MIVRETMQVEGYSTMIIIVAYDAVPRVIVVSKIFILLGVHAELLTS